VQLKEEKYEFACCDDNQSFRNTKFLFIFLTFHQNEECYEESAEKVLNEIY